MIGEMALSIKTNRMLWGRAASRCSLSECRRELVIDALDTDDPSLVGEAAHIIAERPDGPRGHSNLTLEQRNTYANLILLCNVHHKQVDDQVNHFTVQRLTSIKAEHELWVRSNLSDFSPLKQADDERWAGYIEEWASKADLDNWFSETSFLLGANPSVNVGFLDNLKALRYWILSRVWPESSPDLRAALENFLMVLGDFVNVFDKHSKREHDDLFQHVQKFYQIENWDDELYHRLLRRYEFHVALVYDLTFEMTRATNYVCDRVRESLDRGFRIDQGVLLVQMGMDSNLNVSTLRLEYFGQERTQRPYPGLQKYMEIRSSRDYYQGEGREPTE